MKAVFVDTAYWIAVFSKRDSWRGSARQARRRMGAARQITTDDVLVEFLAACAAAGPQFRTEAAGFVRDVLAHPNIEVIPQSRESFLKGLTLYEARRDKSYSLTDCISMNAMRARSITQAVTTDLHFAQEGFSVLMAHPS